MLQPFTFVLDHDPTDDEIELLYDEGCDDAGPETRNGVGLLHFDREAPELADALISAIQDTERAGLTVTAVQCEDLVSLNDVAARTGRTYESVRMWATGQRGPGGFPPAYQGGGVSLYSWAQVLDWLNTNMRKVPEVTELPTYDRQIAVADQLVRARRMLAQSPGSGRLTELLSA